MGELGLEISLGVTFRGFFYCIGFNSILLLMFVSLNDFYLVYDSNFQL